MKKRNYGIDFLRFMSMFYVVMLHILGHGGALYNSIELSSQYNVIWFIEIFAYCAVDIFALISGYVGYREENNKIRLSNYMYLWITVVFYSVLTTLILKKIESDNLSNEYIKKMMFPVTNDLYWYFTQYTIAFLLAPVVNEAVKNISKDNAKKICILIFVWFTFFETLTKRFVLKDGYSAMWLIVLYLFGAIIKKYNFGKSKSIIKLYIYIYYYLL